MDLYQVAFALVAFYGLLVLADCLQLRRKLKSIIAEDKTKKATSNISFCYTVAGKALLKLVESLQYKLAVLNWQAENNAQTTLAPQIIDDESHKAGSFFQGIMNALFTKLRADTVFVITVVMDGKNNVEIKQAHSRNSWVLPPKLNTYLVNFYHSYFKQGDETILGLRDGFQSKSLTGDFYLFGYRYVIGLPIKYLNHDGFEVRGLLWLGYNKNSEPYAHEVNIAKDVCSKIENEFTSQRIIDELSTKVNEEKVINKQRNEFLAHVSHDIRSPLNNIRSIINLMRLEEKDKEQAELLDTALGNCYDVEELINSILDYTRYQAGQLSNKNEIFDLNFLAEDAVSNQKIEARLKNIALNLNYDHDLSILLEVDKKQIKRVINNLISNAIKYTRAGSIDVDLSYNSEGFCTLKVKDTGVGMTEDQLKLLFTPFFRFHQSEADGIGLGLTLTKILVELNGGSIKVESVVNQGSTFEISFPCEARAITHNEETLPAELSAFTEKEISSIEVLVLDDNAVAVESMSRMLLKMGFHVTKCFAVSEAMSIINFSEPHYLITDWHMPDGGAKRLLKYLKMINSKTKVCVLSGSSDEQTKKEIIELGVERMFCKSEDFEELQAWLNSLQSDVKQMDKAASLVA